MVIIIKPPTGKPRRIQIKRKRFPNPDGGFEFRYLGSDKNTTYSGNSEDDIYAQVLRKELTIIEA